jgi:hypothetical protein
MVSTNGATLACVYQVVQACLSGLFPRRIGRFNDLPLREDFIERVFCLRRKAWLSAWQFAAGKLHDRMDRDARG